MQIDKANGDVAFNEEHHKYFNTKFLDRVYTSVTTLIGMYHEKFDEDFWSSYKAAEKLMQEEFIDSGLKNDLLNKKKFDNAILDTFDIDSDTFKQTKLEILESYQAARDVACVRGTGYHLNKELRFYDKEVHKLSEYEFGIDAIDPDKEFVCERNNFDLNRELAILPEYLIYFSTEDKILNLAGQVDFLLKDGNDLYILDYKTNAKGISSKAYFDKKKKKKNTMKYPINNLDDTAMIHYTLQLSLYAWMLQKVNPEFNIKLLRIMHIDGEGIETMYDLPYVKDDIERMLKHYKKYLKVKHFRDTGIII